MIKYFIIMLSIAATIGAQVSLKKGMIAYGPVHSSESIRWIDLFSNINLWLGGSLYIIAFTLYLVLLSRYELSRIYPITTSLAFVIVVMISNNLFNESMSLDKILGIAFILTGITFLSAKL